ncbi:MAG: outer membrane lipoprotein-sorting protein [Williamsia sp.]|nr:outer membrane lipoprotein-sorting protein [Williamsia sp.]
MKNKLIFLAASAILASCLLGWMPRNADDLNEALKKADFYRGGQVPGVAWDLTVRNIEKGELKNEISLFVEASSIQERQFALITFLEPKKFQGQKLLIRDNNMWFSKIELRSPIPISSRQRLSGPAANADVAAANYYNDYSIAGSEEAVLNGEPCWVLDLHAKNNLVPYSRIKYWISKGKNFGLQAEYYGKSDKIIKSALFEYNNKIEYNKSRYDYISKITITDQVNTEDKSTLNISAVKFGSFSDSKFQTNRLKD